MRSNQDREHCRRCEQPVARRSQYGWYCAECLDNAAEAADSWGEDGPGWLRRFEQSLGPLDWPPLLVPLPQRNPRR